MESPPTTPPSSSTSFEDAPIADLLGVSPHQMSMEQLRAYVQRVRSVQLPATFRAALDKSVPKTPGINVQDYLTALMKE